MGMKTLLAGVATLIAIYSYIPYFRDIMKGKTKPHAFSWLVWFLLTAIAFVAQLSDGGGVGSYVNAFTAFVAFFIFVTAIFRGEKDITRSDWACLIGAFVAIGLWILTSQPLLSVILISVIDAIGFLPTFRKSYYKPHQETMQTFVLSSLKYGVAIFALENYSLITILYPASLILMNSLFVAMLVSRRKLMDNKPSDILPV